jgi:proline racemase
MMLAGENVLEGYLDPDDGTIAAHQSPNWLTEPGMVRMEDPVTTLSLGTAADLLTVEADCETETGKCKSV